ncbi:MAG: amino acid ABC transporter ATP-binding protein [Acidobacteria bacterium]|nr:amino acid ABC transporter ATP-binding protein [Acidobacteriota bacterium]
MSAVLSVASLGLRRGAREILRGVSFEVPPHGIVALMGLSGSGKTTILRAVTGLEPFDAGAIVVGPVRLDTGASPHAALASLRRHVGLVFQAHHLFDHLTAIENVALAPVHVQRVAPAAARTRAQTLLDELGVGHRGGALPRELSGGEAQRVAIARALATDPPLLLLDEPTASLDPARRNSLGDTLRAIAATGRALLLTSHDVDFVRDYATAVIVLAQGVVVESGPPQDVLERPRHGETKRLLNAR